MPHPARDRGARPGAAPQPRDRTGSSGRSHRRRRLHSPPHPAPHHLPPLAALDRATGQPVRRYERARPGELVHIDVKKLGRIPDGGGHKALGRAAGRKNRTARGYAYLHTALDDHSRLAYTEDLPDETASPETQTHHNRALEHLTHLIRRLDPADRQVMLLYLDEVDAAGIAEITGLSASHVATKIHRIKARLARLFHQGAAS